MKPKKFTFTVSVMDIPYNKATHKLMGDEFIIGLNEDVYALEVLGECIQAAKCRSLTDLLDFQYLHREKIANGSLSPTEKAKLRHLRERAKIYKTIEVTGRA